MVGRKLHDPLVLTVVASAVVIAATALLLSIVYPGTHQSSGLKGAKGSGVAGSQVRVVGPFTSVELAGSNTVSIDVGPTRSVTVYGDRNLLSRVTTEVHGQQLVIGNTRGSFTTKVPMRVEITVPAIGALALTGSGVVAATNVRAQRLTLTLSGSGTLRASGSAQQLDVALDGSGDAQLETLTAKEAYAVIRGSGRIVVTATDTLDASIPGSGAIVYEGTPSHVTSSVTGSGTVTHG